jgi:hypothetical protein
MIDGKLPRATVRRMSMPQTPDDQPERRETEASSGEAPLAGDGRSEPGVPAVGPGKDTPPTAQTGDQPQPRRRRRRRRRRPRLEPAGASSAAVPAETSAAQPQAPDQPTAPEGALAATPTPAAGMPSRKRRRRRRRRRPAAEGSAAPAAAGAPGAAASGAALQPSAATERKEPRRGRASRRRDGPHRTSRERDDRREPSSGPRADADRGPRDTRDKRAARRPTDRPRHRDRDDARNKPAPKLHRLEAIVDRGFEDLPDPATEGTTRRADWTILKRTIVDQRTTRTVSVVYVLCREGVETEFTQLSAARGAVNKIITHPEKLTPSKADHAAGKGAKK